MGGCENGRENMFFWWGGGRKRVFCFLKSNYDTSTRGLKKKRGKHEVGSKGRRPPWKLTAGAQLERTTEKSTSKTASPSFTSIHLPNRWLVAPYLANALLTPTLDARDRGPIE